MKIKLYRHTIKHTTYIPPMRFIEEYRQTSWSSIKAYVAGMDGEIVKIETKEIEVPEESNEDKS